MNVYRWIRWIILILIATAVYFLNNWFGSKTEVADSAFSNFIISSSVISGIILAYLLAKFYQISLESGGQSFEKEQLEGKITSFRKLLFRLMKSPSFWVKHDDIVLLKRKYPELTFSDIHNEDVESEENENFWKNEVNFSTITADLYLAMEELTGPVADLEEIDTVHAPMKYDMEYISKIKPALNQIWFYLEERYAKHTAGLINDQGVWEPYQDNVRNLASRIDVRFKSREFDRTIVAEISNAFQEDYLPKLAKILGNRQNNVGKSLTSLVITVSILLFSGTIVPILFQSINFSDVVLEKAQFWISLILICGISNLVLELVFILFRDLKSKR